MNSSRPLHPWGSPLCLGALQGHAHTDLVSQGPQPELKRDSGDQPSRQEPGAGARPGDLERSHRCRLFVFRISFKVHKLMHSYEHLNNASPLASLSHWLPRENSCCQPDLELHCVLGLHSHTEVPTEIVCWWMCLLFVQSTGCMVLQCFPPNT